MDNSWKFMGAGFLVSVLLNLPLYHYIHDMDWFWTENFVMSASALCLEYMATFFHELGHTLFAWLYGYPTIPVFDFAHGGGLAISVTGQSYLVRGAALAVIGYGAYLLRDFTPFMIGLAVLGVFILATGFSEDIHMSMVDFMGPGAEALVAGFLLTRALLDISPGGVTERLLNAVFGFGILFQVLIKGFALLRNDAYRLVYFEQKGTHGFGDFDKIAERFLPLGFDGVVTIWLVLACLCLSVPFFLYWQDRRAEG